MIVFGKCVLELCYVMNGKQVPLYTDILYFFVCAFSYIFPIYGFW